MRLRIEIDDINFADEKYTITLRLEKRKETTTLRLRVEKASINSEVGEHYGRVPKKMNACELSIKTSIKKE